MKKFFLFMTVLLFLLSHFAIAASTTYLINPTRTYVLWHIDHFGFSRQSGKFFADGSIEYDEVNPVNSKVNVTVQVATLDTGVRDLTQYLLGELFFAAGRHPLATFVSDKVEIIDQNKANVHGILSIRGISKPAIFAVRLNKIGENPVTRKTTIGFSGVSRVSRSQYGITTLQPGLGDEVALEIEVEAYKK